MVKKESQEYLPTAEDPKGRPWGKAIDELRSVMNRKATSWLFFSWFALLRLASMS